MRDIARFAEKRLSGFECTAAKQFESSLLHNRVHETIREDDRLRHVLDVTERAYALHERKDLPDKMEYVPFNAADDLDEHIDTLVDMAVARECAAVIEDAHDDWFDGVDHPDQAAICDALDEACAWLAKHPDAAEAENIDVDMIWDMSDEIVDSEKDQEAPADV